MEEIQSYRSVFVDLVSQSFQQNYIPMTWLQASYTRNYVPWTKNIFDIKEHWRPTNKNESTVKTPCFGTH